MSRGKKILVGVLAALVLGLGLAWWRVYLPTRYAVEIGAGLLAKQVCSCVFIANRSVEACRADEMASTDAIRLEIVQAAGRVRAFVPGLGERIAVHRSGLGCALDLELGAGGL